jgi:hypothetical protein
LLIPPYLPLSKQPGPNVLVKGKDPEQYRDRNDFEPEERNRRKLFINQAGAKHALNKQEHRFGDDCSQQRAQEKQ